MSTGIGTTGVAQTSSEENNLIKSTLGLTKGESTSVGIIQSLKDDKQSKTKQRESTRDLLLLLDVNIDGYDKLVVNMDKPIPGLLQPINDKITAVKTAYDQRIAAGCLSDLKWVKTGEVIRSVSFFNATSGGINYPGSINVTYEYWQVQKDPAQYRQINYYGAKYYKRPHNRDYGANLVKEIPNGSVGIGSTYIIVFDSNIPLALNGLQIGDTISDDLENPTLFQVGNLPEIVGFGSTGILGFSTTFGGTISLGSTILFHTGSGVVTTGISTGDRIIRVGVTSSDTVVVGFGTTTTTQQILNDAGESGIATATVNTIILSKPAIAATSVSSFGVGITTFYPTIFISTTTPSLANNISFVVIRPDADIDQNFNFNLNGSSPVEIGLLKDESKVGYGHTLQIINNGAPDIITQWKDVIDPEPAVGAGYAPYYEGALSWPGQNVPVYGGIGGTSIVGYSFTYRSEGYQVVIGIGLTTAQPILATTSAKPAGAASTATCNTYTANIVTAESELTAIITQNQPKLNYYANASDVLRDVRDEKEVRAFSLKRGLGFLTNEIETLTNQISILESVDFTEFE
jgi:hypothetical protein